MRAIVLAGAVVIAVLGTLLANAIILAATHGQLDVAGSIWRGLGGG